MHVHVKPQQRAYVPITLLADALFGHAGGQRPLLLLPVRLDRVEHRLQPRGGLGLRHRVYG
jgi:hypothetical protein